MRNKCIPGIAGSINESIEFRASKIEKNNMRSIGAPQISEAPL